MVPLFTPGELIFCKKIIDLNSIVFGEAYVIVTAEHRMIRYVSRGSKKNTLKFTAVNKRFDWLELPIESIKELYLIKGSIKKNSI